MKMEVRKLGNLERVRAELSKYRVGDIVDYVDPGLPGAAEIVPEVKPAWYVIETFPNQERSVAAHLIARRFGMFLPETEDDVIRRGRKVHVARPMFAGYVFVFVWDIEKHWSRIIGAPGVVRVMMQTVSDGVSNAPAVVPDEVIDKIRAVENGKRPLPDVVMTDEVTGKSKKKPRRWRKAKSQPKVEILRVRAWDAFQDAIATLDSDGRNQTLRQALSLCS
jgi:transcription antitermination factor NusG